MTREAGFTLIELLVTATLLSLLMLLLFGGLSFGVRAWDGAEAHGTRTSDLRIVQNLLRREIEQAYPRYDTTDPIHPTVDFRGGPNWVTLLAPAPQASATSGRSHITISAVRDGGGEQLAMRAVPELALSERAGWSTALLRNVASVQFSYFDGQQWRASWSDARTIPSLVRVQVGFARGDGRVWPDLVVAPHIETDALCLYDRTSFRCQGRP